MSAEPRESGRRIVVRVDSSTALGSGHLIRCLTLADELRRRGASVRFVSRESPGHLIDQLEQDGHVVDRLPPYSGPTAERDAADTLSKIQAERPDWLVVDHYALDLQWERALRPAVDRILAVDDLPGRAHDCDVFLDQNWYGPDAQDRYAGRVPESCVRLLGPRYALLQPQYAEARSALRNRDGAVRRVLVYFGASDLTDETGKALDALSLPEFASISVDVVIGANHPNPHAIKTRVESRPATTLHENLPSLAAVMARADLAIGAGGSTTWERICLGLPTLVTTLAENQEPLTAALADEGWVDLVGRSQDVTSEDYRRALLAYAGGGPASYPLVDGFGTKRVAEVMIPTSTGALSLRRARQQDASLFFEWRNDPLTRAMSLTEGPLSWSTHSQWFEQKLKQGEADLYVAEADGLPIGQVRLDFGVDEALLSYSIDRLARGRGWGEWMICEALKVNRRARSIGVKAQVKPENVASRKVFARLGWIECKSMSDMIVFRLNMVTSKGISQ